MIRSTDIYMGSNVYKSRVAHNQYRQASTEICSLIKEAIPELRKLLEFNPYLSYRVSPMRGSTFGHFKNDAMCVEISCRVTIPRALLILTHELIHGEQYYQGRLKQIYEGSEMVWMGRRSSNRGTTYAAYREQPWEVEAFAREPELSEIVAKKLGII